MNFLDVEREKRIAMQETVNRLITELQHERERADRAEAEVARQKVLWMRDVKDEHDQYIRADAGRENALRDLVKVKAEVAGLRVELGETRLVLESQDLRLHRLQAALPQIDNLNTYNPVQHRGLSFCIVPRVVFRNLEAVREAAEDVVRNLEPADPEGWAKSPSKLFGKLNDALAAFAEDPAR